MSSAALPNVIPEFQNFSLNGKLPIVKNTFVDFAEAPDFTPNHRRCKSTPSLLKEFLRSCDEDDEQHSNCDEPLHEVRRRVFTWCDELELASNASTQVPSSMSSGPSSMSSAGVDVAESSVTIPPTQLSLASCLNLGAHASDPMPAPQVDGPQTTLMFRNLPVWFTRQHLEELLDKEGFGSLYDFIYLPAELGSGTCFGYAFINMVTSKDAERFVNYFQGFDQWPVEDARRAVVHLSEALQGLDEQIERYRNSPLMHPSVPDPLRPAVYSRGIRIAFPAPTAPIRAPRVRTSAKRKVPPRQA